MNNNKCSKLLTNVVISAKLEIFDLYPMNHYLFFITRTKKLEVVHFGPTCEILQTL